MGVLRFQNIFFRSFLGSSGTTQALFIFLLIPCCLTQEFRAPPFIPSVSFLWGWNAPTELCAKRFNVQLDLNLFSLIGSPQKGVTGQGIALFYTDRLGYYPHINKTTGKIVNGGIPQLGSLKKHLDKAKKDISHYIETDSMGLAVIDWDCWKPNWARNWRPRHMYKEQSIDLAQQQHIHLNLTEVTKIAQADFEKAGKCFMQETLKLGKFLRPNYLWGFYLYPDCYNYNYKSPNYNGSCFDIEQRRNDEINWLWKESTALFPSIYLNSKLKSSPFAALYVRNRVLEAIRVSKVKNVKHPLPIFVYARPVFTDVLLKYLTEEDLVNTIGESVSLGVSGMVMWGSLNLTQNVQICTELDAYIKNKLNPYIINVTLAAKMCSQVLCQDQGVCIRKHWNSNDYLHLNPVNFAIQLERSGRYTVQGKPTLEDLQQFSKKFYCACYANTQCKERVDLTDIHTVKVCVGEDVCIDVYLNSVPSGHLSDWKGKYVTSSNIFSAMPPPATGPPCVSGRDLNRCLKARFIVEDNSKTTQTDYQSIHIKNKKQ